MGTVDWVRVTSARPCPVCGRTHYCSVSVDGGLVYCTKEPSNRIGSDGTGWIHKMNGHANGHTNGRARGRETRYEVRDADGVLVAVHCRVDTSTGKRVWWEMPDGTKKLVGLTPADLPLYRVDHAMEVYARSATSEATGLRGTVVVAEGEKATDALDGLDVLAVGTVTGAATIPSDASLLPLVGFHVCLWPDNDEPGHRHMERIGRRLKALGAPSVRVFAWPDAPEKGDAADFVAAGLGRPQLNDIWLAGREIDAEPEPEPDAPTEEPGADLHLTDMGNAERLIRRHGPDLRYCAAWKRWVVWGGETWASDGDGLVQERAKETVLAIYEEGVAAGSPERAAALWKHAQRSESAGRIHALIDLARSVKRLVVSPDDLDRDPLLLSCANGTIDLEAGTLRAFCREDLMSKRSPALYDAAATCPAWLAFLDQIMAGDPEMVAYLQRVAGYCLTGMTVERVMFILFGAGRNGKSTFLEVLRYVLGDYASGTPASTIMSQRNKGIPNDIARLKGARFVSASETSEGAEIDEAFVKVATGGDTITARFLNAEFFDFRPQFKILLATNHKPSIKGTDPAVWDRIHLIPFLVRIPDDQVDKGLRDRLVAEADGILRWAIEGCRIWRQLDSLAPPTKVREATDEYRLDEDVLRLFLEDRCTVGRGFAASAKSLYEAYQEWSKAHGEDALSQTKFGRRLRERGFQQTRSMNNRRWSGIGLFEADPGQE